MAMNNASVENNFIGGLKTEYTALNFPENACTSVDNCVFSLIGDVYRRSGIDFEDNFDENSTSSVSPSNVAVNQYKWDNAGGDGVSEIVVVQMGVDLVFFYASQAPINFGGLSAQTITPTIYIPQFQTNLANNVADSECQFSSGNGYLFVFHPDCDPFYVTFDPAGPAFTASVIPIQTRDFAGINPEPGNPSISTRPSTLTSEHEYNLQNQGWTAGNLFSYTSSTNNLTIINGNSVGYTLGSNTFTIATGQTIANGTAINISWTAMVDYNAVGDGSYIAPGKGTAFGTVTSYTSGSGALVMDITAQTTFSPGVGSSGVSGFSSPATILSAAGSQNTITTWFNQIGNYPSNSDIWYEYKDAGTISGENGVPTFNPADTIAQVSTSFGQAPQGHFVMDEFDLDRSAISGISGLTVVSTNSRPKTGAFYAGRVWFSGVDGAFVASGDASFYTWTERVYFSQVVTSIDDFGNCYQVNDPTDENLNQLLPTDGGVIFIQGSGSIYKLFPIQNGVLVFAANGIWFITGGSSLGFTADDYTITKISAVQSISGTSIVDVNGLPFFWNEEGIYAVTQGQDQVYKYGGFQVEPLTVGTILTFYNNIPFDSKRYARGAYNPITYVVSWVYRSTEENGISNRYVYDSSLNLNVFNKAFYPYSFANSVNCFINGIIYVNYPSGDLTPTFKYFINLPSTPGYTYAEENDDVNWVDFFSFDSVGVDYSSYFTSGYKVHGQAFRKWDPVYVVLYSNNEVQPNSYAIQGIWDFADTYGGGFSNPQVITNPPIITFSSGLSYSPQLAGQDFIYRRHKIRGHGESLQIKVSSIDGMPFHIIGWAIPEQINPGA